MKVRELLYALENHGITIYGVGQVGERLKHLGVGQSDEIIGADNSQSSIRVMSKSDAVEPEFDNRTNSERMIVLEDRVKGLSAIIDRLSAEARDRDAERIEICKALDCHPAHILDQIKANQSLLDELPSRDAWRNVCSKAQSLEEENKQLRQIVHEMSTRAINATTHVKDIARCVPEWKPDTQYNPGSIVRYGCPTNGYFRARFLVPPHVPLPIIAVPSRYEEAKSYWQKLEDALDPQPAAS